MSVDAFSGLPFQAGHAVAAGVGRTAKWAIGAYMRAPLRNTAIAALTTLSAMAGSNALYHQAGHHPAPLFGNFGSAATNAAVEPVMPVERPVKLLVTPAPETTGSVSKSVEPVANKPIGNEDVFELQRKLTAFKFFDGKVDGLFGPRTSRSIRAFEASVGRQPTGQLTPEIIELIKATPITAEPALKLELPAITTAPVAAEVPAEVTADKPVVLALEDKSALPAPAPLVVGSVDPAPEATADLSLETTDEGEGVSTLEMTSPAEDPAPVAEATVSPTKRAVQTIAITAPAVAIAPIVTTPIDPTKAASDPIVVGEIQRGLASLGFLHGAIDGVAGEATAKAIRNFEVYYNYNVTGRITPELVNLLVQNGAVI